MHCREHIDVARERVAGRVYSKWPIEHSVAGGYCEPGKTSVHLIINKGR